MLAANSAKLSAMLRRLILTFMLALLFGLGQQGAVVHEISHFADINSSSQQQDKAPHSPLCEKCLSYSGLASALGVSYFMPPTMAAGFEPYVYYSSTRLGLTSAVYSARAPPVPA